MEPGPRRVRDAAEDIGEQGLRIDIDEPLRGHRDTPPCLRAAWSVTLRNMELAARTGLIVALVYGVVVGLTYIVQRQPQYFPHRRMYSPLEGGVPEMSVVRFNAADCVQLISWRHAAAVDAPLLIVHGEDELTIPVAHGRRMLAAAREPKQGVFIAGAGHDDLRAHGADAAILRFLAATFPPE